MNQLRKYYERKLISYNLKPYKVIKLKTGIEVEHYTNGNLKVT
jgi:hypothetical protein